MKTILKSNNIFCSAGKISNKYIVVENGIITDLPDYVDSNVDIIDVENLNIIPGFVDIHTHGAINIDFMDIDTDKINKLLEFYLKNGVTSVMPTMVADNFSRLQDITSFYIDYIKNGKYSDMLLGLHFESPYISSDKAGAQPKNNIRYLNETEKEFWINTTKNNDLKIRLTIAPEIVPIDDIKLLLDSGVVLSVGHTNCSYEEAKAVFDCGVNSITHLFNAMPGIHHRKPGPIVAAAENENVLAEIICDWIHVRPEIVMMAKKIFDDRLILISDSIRSTGLDDGEYQLGDNTFYMKNGICKLADGTIAGSTTTILKSFKKFMNYANIDINQIIKYTSLNATNTIKYTNYVNIKKGCVADLIGIDNEYKIKFIMKSGKLIKKD